MKNFEIGAGHSLQLSELHVYYDMPGKIIETNIINKLVIILDRKYSLYGYTCGQRLILRSH